MARLDLPLDDMRHVLGSAPGSNGLKILLLRHRPGRDGEPQETAVLPEMLDNYLHHRALKS